MGELKRFGQLLRHSFSGLEVVCIEIYMKIVWHVLETFLAKFSHRQQQHADSNKTGITPTLLVLEVQDAPWGWFVKSSNMSELTLYLYGF